MLLSTDLREGYKKEVSIITLFQDGEPKMWIELLKVIQCESWQRNFCQCHFSLEKADSLKLEPCIEIH